MPETNTNNQATETQAQGQATPSANEKDIQGIVKGILDSEEWQKSLEGKIFKSFKDELTKQGFSNKEIGEGIKVKNQLEEEQKQANSQEFETLKNSNLELQNQFNLLQESLKQEKLSNAAQLVAMELGITKEQMPFITKMCDFSQAINKKGEINTETIKGEIEKVFNAFPALKPQEKSSGNDFFKMGADVNAIGNNLPYQNQTQVNAHKNVWNKFNR